jgi:hypothetical protein
MCKLENTVRVALGELQDIKIIIAMKRMAGILFYNII